MFITKHQFKHNPNCIPYWFETYIQTSPKQYTIAPGYEEYYLTISIVDLAWDVVAIEADNEYETFRTMVETGTYQRNMLSKHDSITGNIIRFRISDFIIYPINKDGSAYPLPTAPAMETVSVTFPTGEVLVSDWFRYDTFNETVDDAIRYKLGYSLNYPTGRTNVVKHYANVHNFISVHVGNSCPNVYQLDENTLIIGHTVEDSNLNSIATVCTDLWNATLIDKQTLVGIVGECKTNKYESITVKAGKWQCMFSSGGKTTQLLEELMDISEFDEVYAVLKYVA